MYFTSGSDRAFEQLMQGKPGFDHYDSGEAVTPEDCGTCRFYRPHWKYQFCVYAECPYQPGKLTAYDAVTFRVKGVENMAVFRVERNKGYTVMSNHHLRNKDLSLKAKGLLSQMLSLPEDWDYTLKGLSLINREQIDAIRAAIRELEQAGYIVRSRERDSQGRLRGADYVIYEQPQPVPDSPTLENPMLDNPTQEKPTLGKPTQLNKDISSKEKSITDVSITDPIPIHSTENQVIVDVALVDVGCQHIGVFALQHFVGKLLADLMGLYRRGLAGGKGLDQVVGQIVAFLDRLRQQHFKFYVRCFIGAAKGGHQHFVLGLVRVLDVVQRLFQR